MSRVNNVCLFVFNYLPQRYYELSKARFYNFVPAFRKLPKGGTEIVQACDSYHMSWFCASVVLAFISGVGLFDYVLDWGKSARAWLGEPNGGLPQESNPKDAMPS